LLRGWALIRALIGTACIGDLTPPLLFVELLSQLLQPQVIRDGVLRPASRAVVPGVKRPQRRVDFDGRQQLFRQHGQQLLVADAGAKLL
jgi:hypothetical protein